MKIFEWFESVFQGLANALTAPIIEVKEWIADKITEALINFLLGANPAGTDQLQEALKPLIEDPDIPERLKPILKEWTSHTPPIIAALAPVIGALVAYPAVSAGFSGSLEELKQVSFAYTRPSLLPVDLAIRAKWRGLSDDSFVKQELAWASYDDKRQGLLEDIAKFYPGAQDLIRFMVRDTFNDAVVKRYNYDDQYPTAIDDYAKKSGVSPDWMKHFWRAHWELPSPTQMYEMLHRGKITLDDARLLLKTADVAPYFVEPMLAISYNPYTRVDIRRMYDEGVLSKDEVLKAYQDIGYDKEHAQKLTDFTTKESLSRERDLTLAQTLEAYTEGEIASAKATENLIALGYDTEEAKLVLKLEDDKIERGLRKREKAIYVTKYAKGIITLKELENGLDALKMSEREKKISIEEAKLKVKEAAVNKT